MAGEVNVFLTTSGVPLEPESLLADDDKKMYLFFNASFRLRKFSGYSSYSMVFRTRCLVVEVICDCRNWWLLCCWCWSEPAKEASESRKTAFTDTGILQFYAYIGNTTDFTAPLSC